MNNQELLDYAIKMRERGDTYRRIDSHVNSNVVDEAEASRILKKVVEMEENGTLIVEDPNASTGVNTEVIIGGVIAGLGVALFFALKGRGFISTLPIVLTGIGAVAIGRAVNKRK